MIDHPRLYEPPMCDYYHAPPAPSPTPLDTFQVFGKGSGVIYSTANYYNHYYDVYDTELESAGNNYHTLVNSTMQAGQEHHRDPPHTKCMADWTEEDTMSWMIETAQRLGYSELELPYYQFKVTGAELKAMKKDEMLQRMYHPSVDHALSRILAELVYDKVQKQSQEETIRDSYIGYIHEASQTMLDLDSLDNRRPQIRGRNTNVEYASVSKLADSNCNVGYGLCDSSDDAEDPFPPSATASPVYYSDYSKSSDEEDKRKPFKRPPGRPKGSGRKVNKRTRNVPVPEFLKNLLLDSEYCPSVIKWEDYSQGKFRFKNPDAVAKLWGKLKNNDNMTFEKFSRAMRYHYKQGVLVSVPSARLVYQFGPRGPDYRTDNPNFLNVKPETEKTHC